MKPIFRKKVSCGSKFNQVYIPRNLDGIIEVGDEVEVRLIRKEINLCYSKGLDKLSEFKERLIRGIFSELKKYKEIKVCFVVGSFLIKIINYNDIDVVIIVNDKLKNYKNLESKIYDELINKFNQNFHFMFIPESKFNNLLKICPITSYMLKKHISNRDITLKFKRELNKNHINFLLMMPEDLLEISVSSKVFLNNVRRLIVIEKFLDKKLLAVDNDLKNLINKSLYERMNSNEFISNNEIEFLRNIIKIKLKKIKEKLKNE